MKPERGRAVGAMGKISTRGLHLTVAWMFSAMICGGCRQPSVQNGAAVFKKNCAACHLPAQGITKFAPPLSGYYKKTPQPTDRQTRKLIRDGHNFMPPFRHRLTPEQIDDVVVYLRTISGQR